MEISLSSNSITDHHIATKFGTCHDSPAVVPCAKYCSDHFISIWMGAKWNFHHIWIVMDKLLVKWAPGPVQLLYSKHFPGSCFPMDLYYLWYFEVEAQASLPPPRYAPDHYTETEMSSFWRNFRHWLHWKLSFWQLSVQPVMKISSKWWHFRFSVCSAILMALHAFNTCVSTPNPTMLRRLSLGTQASVGI